MTASSATNKKLAPVTQHVAKSAAKRVVINTSHREKVGCIEVASTWHMYALQNISKDDSPAPYLKLGAVENITIPLSQVVQHNHNLFDQEQQLVLDKRSIPGSKSGTELAGFQSWHLKLSTARSPFTACLPLTAVRPCTCTVLMLSAMRAFSLCLDSTIASGCSLALARAAAWRSSD